ncbi:MULTISPECIES: helix-turn-helix domain-containing protein [unclassified Streptomyces]|uniref:helix-turn-helix domain-containing protein n=1 Tax=unclassified Streptomyces TaxID=2593676 RepID=UPI0036E66E69
MISDPAEEPPQTDRTDVDLVGLLALAPGEAPSSSRRPTASKSTVRRADGRATTRSGQDRRDSSTPHHAPTTQSAPGDPALDANGGEMVRLFTAEQAARELQVPPSWLRKKAAAGAIPHTRIGRHLRFSTSDLRRLIAAGQRGPTHARHG